MFLREYSTGTYGAVPYFLSKMCVELPMYFCTSLLILLIQYWSVEFNAPFMILVVEIFITAITSASYAFLAGASVSTVKVAQELSPLLFVPQLLFAGFFIRIDQIPVWMRWIQYLCALKFSINLSGISEFGGNRCAEGVADPVVAAERVKECAALLESNDMNEDLIGLYVGILIGIFVCFRTGSLFVLIQRAKSFSS